MNRRTRLTIATVAEQAGRSVAPVDRMLNARAPVNPQTAERVFLAPVVNALRCSARLIKSSKVTLGGRVFSCLPPQRKKRPKPLKSMPDTNHAQTKTPLY